MTNAEATTTENAATVAEQGAHVAPEKASSKKGASQKKGAPKAKKGARATKPKKEAKAGKKAILSREGVPACIIKTSCQRVAGEGIFWSNDPRVTVGRMVRSLGLSQQEEELKRIRKLYQSAGVPSY